MTDNKRNWIYTGVPLAGLFLVLWYVLSATSDVAYSDYLRQTLSYLPDVWNPEKFFVPDILTRIPINFPVRAFNVTVLGFSVTFDLILGVLGLGLAGFVIGAYCRKRKVGIPWFLIMMFLFFGLNKWEMLINGTGWVHFLAFACFYYHYVVLDRVEAGDEKKGDRTRLKVLPFVITLCIAGPYCAIYSGVLLLAYGFLALWRKKKTGRWDRNYLVYAVCVLIPLFLYMWSNSKVVDGINDIYKGPLLPILEDNPLLFVKFFVKSFGSMMIGTEALIFAVEHGCFPYFVIYGLSAAVMGAYLIALWLNVKYRLYEKTIFPLILIMAGGMNHVLILLSRWRFLDDAYGMSSRYALQYQVGIMGILLTVAFLWNQMKSRIWKVLITIWCVLIILGNAYTDGREIQAAPWRKAWADTAGEMAHHLEDYTDEEILRQFQYRTPELTKKALKVLEENQLNMYRPDSGYGDTEGESK